MDFVIFSLRWRLLPSMSVFLALFSTVMIAYEVDLE